jgi:RNA polymerase sigma-70 factor (ECF subfamily)
MVNVGIESQPLFVDHFADLTTQQLLELCLSVESTEAAWCELVSRAQRTIRGTIFKSLRKWTLPTHHLVDDLVQRTFMKLMANDCKALREFRPQHDNAFPGFLKVVASRIAEDYRRQVQGQKEVPLTLVDPIGPSPGPDREILLEQLCHYLKDAASSQECDVFWLYHKQGFTAKEISELPGFELTDKQVEYILWKLMRLLLDKFASC